MITKKKVSALKLGQDLIELGLKVQRKEIPLDIVTKEIDSGFLEKVSKNSPEWEADIEPRDRILALMEIQGITKSGLAKKLGISRQYVTSFLNGNNPVTLKSAKNIARALDVPLAGIIGG